MPSQTTQNRQHKSRLHIAKRDDVAPVNKLLINLLALGLALLTGALLLLALGHNPFSVYASMLKGALGNRTGMQETIKMSVPLLVCGIGLSLAFRMNFWNIGGEGQLLVGGIAATSILVYFPDSSYAVKMLLMVLVALLAGGLYAALPAFFKTRWDTNETLFTLMLNYVALQFVRYLMYRPTWQDPGTRFPKIFHFGEEQMLPKAAGVHAGWVVAIIMAVLAWVYLNKSKHGYEISVVGDSLHTARYAGMNVSWIQIRTLFLSGAICGLAGYFQVAGADGTLTESTAGGVGFTAITVAWLSRLNPLVMLIIAPFIAVLKKGSITIQSTFLIPASAADLLIGLILFFMLGADFFCNYQVKGFRQEAKA